MRLWNLLLSVSLVLAAGLGLLVLSGGARGLMAPSLEARLVVQDFRVPADFGIDPPRVAEFMAAELQTRMEQDVAMRMTLPDKTLRTVQEIVLPRLMNVVVVQAMMRDIPELSAILEITNFRHSVAGQVMVSEAARDVVLTVPGALLAEVNGEKHPVTTTSTGLTVIELGDLEPGQVVDLTVWAGETPPELDFGRAIRIGADRGKVSGRVLLWGGQGWFGADMEALRWSRWLVGALLTGVMLFGLASLILPLLSQRQAWARRSARHTELR